MKIAVIILIVLGVIAASAIPIQSHLDEKWEQWKTQYRRIYPTAEEELIRKGIFHVNLIKAENLNKIPGNTAKYGATKFSDITTEEFKMKYLMSDKTRGEVRPEQKVWVDKTKIVTLPISFDWDGTDIVTPVKNQGDCGSCWAFSATESVESVWAVAKNSLPVLSEQQIVDCDTYDDGCDGGWPYTAYQYLINAGGQDSEVSYPYTGEDGTCAFKTADILASISSWQYVTQTLNESAMAVYVLDNSPISVCVDAETWQYYTSGVISTGCGRQIDHCVQVTGWAIVDGVLAWHVRNSWGTDWGLAGYLWVKRGGNICDIASVVTIPVV